MLEFLFEIFGEFLIQVIGEALVEIGLHTWADRSRRPVHPLLSMLGHAFFGAVIGGLSLLVFPHNLVPPQLRLPNLVLTPLAVGGLMAWMGAWRARRGQAPLQIDRFACGSLFAFALALVRFRFAA